MWEIAVPSKSPDPAKQRWGRELYETREDAERELRQFWKGVSGVDLKKFVIREAQDDR